MTAESRNGIKLTSSMRKRRSHRGRIFVTLSGSAIALLLALGVATAQTESSSPARKNNSVYAELAKAPKKAAGRRNPLEADSDAVAAGGKLFAMHCAECHGEMAEGGKKAPSLLADEVQRATPGTLFWLPRNCRVLSRNYPAKTSSFPLCPDRRPGPSLLTNGVVRHGMPVWSKLPEPQRWQLVRFIKSLTFAAQASSNGEKTAHP